MVIEFSISGLACSLTFDIGAPRNHNVVSTADSLALPGSHLPNFVLF
jgi:hypothetical protein